MFRRLHLRGRKNRRFAAFTAAVLTAVSLFSLPVRAAEELTDLNNDGIINVYDYILAKRGSVEASEPITLSVSSADAAPGSTVTVNVSLKNNKECCSAYLLIKYHNGLILPDTEDAAVLNTEAFGELTPHLTAYPGAGKVNYISLSSQSSSDNGVLFQMKVKVPEDAVPGTVYTIEPEQAEFRNADGYIPMLTERGKITVVQTAAQNSPRPYLWQGIDVSQWQGNIDWKTFAEQSDLKYAMLRAGFGRKASQVDKKFYQNYANAKAAGVPVGAYWYSYAMTPAEAVLEAQACAEVIKDCVFEYPIAFDFEEPKQLALPVEETTAIIDAFCREMESRGYYVVLYCSSFFLNRKIGQEVKDRYDVWVAHYNVKRPTYTGSYGMWQYGIAEDVSGIAGAVDMDYCYKNYPAIMRRAKLNGYQDPPAPPEIQEPEAETPAEPSEPAEPAAEAAEPTAEAPAAEA